jgi:hypothetical protein
VRLLYSGYFLSVVKVHGEGDVAQRRQVQRVALRAFRQPSVVVDHYHGREPTSAARPRQVAGNPFLPRLIANLFADERRFVPAAFRSRRGRVGAARHQQEERQGPAPHLRLAYVLARWDLSEPEA